MEEKINEKTEQKKQCSAFCNDGYFTVRQIGHDGKVLKQYKQRCANCNKKN